MGGPLFTEIVSLAGLLEMELLRGWFLFRPLFGLGWGLTDYQCTGYRFSIYVYPCFFCVCFFLLFVTGEGASVLLSCALPWNFGFSLLASCFLAVRIPRALDLGCGCWKGAVCLGLGLLWPFCSRFFLKELGVCQVWW